LLRLFIKMKKEFSTKWKASKQPRKQRKFIAKAPLHIKRKMLSIRLSKDLIKKHEQKNIVARKGDIVKIMKGNFKKKQGKITEIKLKTSKIYVEGIQVKKMDGSKANVPLKAPNLQIIELNLNDKKRKLKNKNPKTEKENLKQQKEEKK
jgi:large subunit ribosomal protein L24